MAFRKKVCNRNDLKQLLFGKWVDRGSSHSSEGEICYTDCCLIVWENYAKYSRTRQKQGASQYWRPPITYEECVGLWKLTGRHPNWTLRMAYGDPFYSLNNFLALTRLLDIYWLSDQVAGVIAGFALNYKRRGKEVLENVYYSIKTKVVRGKPSVARLIDKNRTIKSKNMCNPAQMVKRPASSLSSKTLRVRHVLR